MPKKKLKKRQWKRQVRYATYARENYYIIFGGVALVILGFVLLAQGLTHLPVILLVAGYLVVIPYGILYRKKTHAGTRQKQS